MFVKSKTNSIALTSLMVQHLMQAGYPNLGDLRPSSVQLHQQKNWLHQASNYISKRRAFLLLDIFVNEIQCVDNLLASFKLSLRIYSCSF